MVACAFKWGKLLQKHLQEMTGLTEDLWLCLVVPLFVAYAKITFSQRSSIEPTFSISVRCVLICKLFNVYFQCDAKHDNTSQSQNISGNKYPHSCQVRFEINILL